METGDKVALRTTYSTSKMSNSRLFKLGLVVSMQDTVTAAKT